MTLIQFVRLLNANIKFLILSSLLLAITVYLFTRNIPKVYTSETRVYTGITSGVSVASMDMAGLNYFATNSAFDNLLQLISSRQTIEEVGERLLAQHLFLTEPDSSIISDKHLEELYEVIPEDVRNQMINRSSLEVTYERIKKYKKDNSSDQLVIDLFYNEQSPYSYLAISKIKARRMESSDIIQVTYEWTDPGICMNTLGFINEVFMRNYTGLKIAQTGDVVGYFREQVRLAEIRLLEAENTLKKFRTDNRVLNYYEQTKFIAEQKEELENEYQKELSIKVSAEAAVEKLEIQLSVNKMLLKFADDILDKREELAKINAKLASLEVYYNDPELLAQLRARVVQLKAELTASLDKKYEYAKTTEGMPIETLLKEWLAHTLELDRSLARIEIFEKRKQYFDKVYGEFAPLGSTLKKIEREVGVAERAYLDMLHNLALAILRQKNVSMSSGGLIVSNPPFFPIEPLPSKALMLVIAAGFVGFFLPLAIILILEFLDSTIKTPERGEDLTGLKLAGAYPLLEDKKNRVDYEWLKRQSVGILIQNIKLEAFHRKLPKDKPIVLSVFSTRMSEGKTTLIHAMGNKLVSIKEKVLVITYSNEDFEEMSYDIARYENNGNETLMSSKSIEELIGPGKYKLKDYTYIIVEIPSLLNHQYSIDIVQESSIALTVARANRAWNKADDLAMSELVETIGFQPRIAVNGVKADNMESVVGEIKKSRTIFRVFLKKLVTLQFSSKKGFMSL